MSAATAGQTVSIHYTGTLEDGTTFDSSLERDPLQFELGSGQIIPGLDNAIDGMTVGETKKVTIQPDQAYGPRDEEMVQAVPRDALPAEIEPEVGLQLQGQAPDGQVTQFIVTEVTEDSITLDANHPLAGAVLVFDVEVVGISG